MAAISKFYAAQSVGGQVRALQSLADAVEVLVHVHYVAGIPNNAANTMAAPWVDNIKPHLLMQRLHRFLPHEPQFELSPQELRAVRLHTLHTLHTLLGRYSLSCRRKS